VTIAIDQCDRAFEYEVPNGNNDAAENNAWLLTLTRSLHAVVKHV
jgi:hypothetical protein